MWSSSTAWMLATSGLVEDLKNKDSDKSYKLPGYFITYCCYKILLCSIVNYTFTKLQHFILFFLFMYLGDITETIAIAV